MNLLDKTIFFTVQEVADMLKLSVLTIYKYIKEQQLEAVEFGGHYRITQSSLEIFIRNNTVSYKAKMEKNASIHTSTEGRNK